MRCPSCTPDYCACADFYGGRLKYWKGEMMTDKPTAPDLAALSEAATQGVWHVAAYYRNSGTPDEICGGFIEADDSPTGVIDENWMQDSESLSRDLDFITALVNEYRAGRLVQIDEGTRERVAEAIAPEVFARPRINLFKRDYDKAYERADAAIAAMMGGAK